MRKGSWAFYLNYPQIPEVRNSDDLVDISSKTQVSELLVLFSWSPIQENRGAIHLPDYRWRPVSRPCGAGGAWTFLCAHLLHCCGALHEEKEVTWKDPGACPHNR